MERPEEYSERLKSVLRDGFWMTTPEERIATADGLFCLNSTLPRWEPAIVPMTCFTEVNLSRTREHTDKFGRMGIGVSRQWLTERQGGPVHYVPSSEQSHSPAANAVAIAEILRRLSYTFSDSDETKFILDEVDKVSNYLGYSFAFLKSMGDESEAGDRSPAYLDEEEWRVVWTHGESEKSPEPTMTAILRVTDPNFGACQAILFVKPQDVTTLVFPDDEVMAFIWRESWFQEWLGERERPPVMATIEDCASF